MSEFPLQKKVDALEAKVAVIATGLNAILTELAGVGEAELAEKECPSWNASKIAWVEAEGKKGKYERYPAEGEKAESIPDYKDLLADLKAYGGKLTRDGYFFWLFTADKATVGRKRRE